MSVKIHVDERHIKDSKRGMADHCMVAEAVREQLNVPSDWGVWVDGDSVEIVPIASRDDWRYGDRMRPVKDSPIDVVLPKHVQSKIERFDNWPVIVQGESDRQFRKDVEPFTFILDIPEDWREQVANAAKGK